MDSVAEKTLDQILHSQRRGFKFTRCDINFGIQMNWSLKENGSEAKKFNQTEVALLKDRIKRTAGRIYVTKGSATNMLGYDPSGSKWTYVVFACQLNLIYELRRWIVKVEVNDYHGYLIGKFEMQVYLLCMFVGLRAMAEYHKGLELRSPLSINHRPIGHVFQVFIS